MKNIDFTRWETWAWSLGSATIGGSATALSAMQGADWIGHPLDWHQIGAVAIAGGFWSAVAFLKSSPLPIQTFTVSQTTTKTVDVSGMPPIK